jgi:hypothetical protein
MPQTRRANGETVEDLGAKDVQFDVETAEGTVQIILPALDGEDAAEPDR